MGKRDVTGEVAQRTVRVLGKLRGRLKDDVPYGPLREQLTSKEARLRLQKIDPVTKIELIQKMGEDEWSKLVERITNGT